MTRLERARNEIENASTAVSNALTTVHTDVVDANLKIARHRATAAMEERKRRRLSAGGEAAAAVASGAPSMMVPADRHREIGLDDDVLNAQAQVQDMLRAMARVHSRARELGTRVAAVEGTAGQLLAPARLCAVKESENENSCELILLLLAHANLREPLLRSLSVRRLWLLRRVCRAFRTLATAALEATPRPIVGGWVQHCEEDGCALEVLNLSTMCWEPLPPLSQSLRSAGICCREGRLVVAGGSKRKNPESQSTALTRIAECCEFDPSSQTWSSLPPFRTPRSACRLVACGSGRVLVLGGAGRARLLLDSVEMLEPGALEWVELAPMRRSRVHFAAGVLPCGRVIVAGGVIPDVKQSKQGEAINRAEIYDPSSNTWEEIATLPAHCRAATGGWLTPDGRFAVYGLGPHTVDEEGASAGDGGSSSSSSSSSSSAGRDKRDPAGPNAERVRHACAYDPATDSWEPLWQTTFKKERGQECSMATAIHVRGSFIVTGGFKRSSSEEDGGGGGGSSNNSSSSLGQGGGGSSRLTCTELRDDESGQNFMLPFGRTTPRERLFSTLWPSAAGREEEAAAAVGPTRGGSGACAAAAWKCLETSTP
eukprot:COSAG06_NODE_1504_length_9251_cov_2.694821_6_plen_599_part_00